MLIPKDRTALTVWNRSLTSYDSQNGFQIVSSLTPEQHTQLTIGNPDPELLICLEEKLSESTDGAQTLSQLQELDQSYNGWIPGALTSHPEELNLLQQAHSRRRLFFGAAQARPALPSSILRISKIIEDYSPKSIFLDSDINGISLCLSKKSSIVIGATDTRYTPWLESECRRLVGHHPIQSVSESNVPKCDAALFTVTNFQETAEALQRAFDATAEDAHFFILVRDPWDGAFARFLRKVDWDVQSVHRDINHWILPGGLPADGGGDLLVLKRPSSLEKALATIEISEAENIRSLPYYTLDLDGLPPENLNDTTLLQFADHLSAIAPAPQVHRYHRVEGERQTLRWGDDQGHEVIIEMRRQAGHLLATFMPYDEQLEWATIVLMFQTLGDASSRLRPTRSHWAGTQTLFA